jgi:ABC-type glycerol-3-phosphate transport system substrate-binding protein
MWVNRVSTKAVVPVLAAAVVVGGLGTGFTRAPAAAKPKVVLTLWWPNAANGDPSEVAVNRALVLWNKTHPDIQVKPTVMPYSQIQTKVTLAATTHQLPDMAVTLPGLIAQYYNMGILDNLSPYLKGWAGKSQVYNSVWGAVTVNGKIMAMPQYTDVRALLYHTTDFAKAGITQPPKTWSQLIADGLKLKKKGIAAYGITGTGVREPQELFAYLAESGTNIANEMPDHKYRNLWAVNATALKEATAVFQFYATLRKDGLIPPQQASWH